MNNGAVVDGRGAILMLNISPRFSDTPASSGGVSKVCHSNFYDTGHSDDPIVQQTYCEEY